jgi:hypothetical protein
VGGLRPSAILLSHDHKIGHPGRGQDDVSERSAVSILLAPVGYSLGCATYRFKECLSELRIALAIGLRLLVGDDHIRGARHTRRYEVHGRRDRETDQVGTKTIGNFGRRTSNASNPAQVVAMHEYRFVGHWKYPNLTH